MAETESSQLKQENKFLKRQNKSFLELLDIYEALSFYYSQLFFKRDVDEAYQFFIDFIEEFFVRQKKEIWGAIFIPDEESLEFQCKYTCPVEASSDILTAEFDERIDSGVVTWSMKNRKLTFFRKEKSILMFFSSIFSSLYAGIVISIFIFFYDIRLFIKLVV